MKYETMLRLNEQLIKNLGSAEAYIVLKCIDKDLSNRIDDIYEAEYDAAPEEDHSGDNMFEAALNPNYVMSKAQVIAAWAGDIVRILQRAYVDKLGDDGLEALCKLASLDGDIYTRIEIAQGVTIPLCYTRPDACNYLP